MTENKRKFKRFHETVNIKWSKGSCKGKEGIDEARSSDVTEDIGEGGVRFIVYEKLKIGDPLSLEIKLPNGKTICSNATVQWTKEFEIMGKESQKGYEIGVKFVDLCEETKAELQRFLSWVS